MFISEARELSQQLRALVALSEDQSLGSASQDHQSHSSASALPHTPADTLKGIF